MKINQDIKRGKMVQNELVLERARNMSLDYNFVTELTSLLVRIDDGSRNSQKKVFRFGRAGDGSTPGPGMSTPIDSSFNISTLIKPEENSGDPCPCKITLYSEDFYMSRAFCSSVPDLSRWDFDEKLEGVKVEGTCDWKIFSGETLSHSLSLSDSFNINLICSGKSYKGDSETFTSSQRYLEYEDVGEVYLNALSVKKLK